LPDLATIFSIVEPDRLLSLSGGSPITPSHRGPWDPGSRVLISEVMAPLRSLIPAPACG